MCHGMASAVVDLSGDLQVIVNHLDASDLSMCADRRQLSPRERSVLCNLNRSALSTTIHLQSVVYNPHRVTSSLLLSPCCDCFDPASELFRFTRQCYHVDRAVFLPPAHATSKT